uniref:Heat shock protein 70 n=1 Tax=Spumella elongata TaxID=89044 RepID=A0A7S3MBA8_9STRA|eukprot:CAMPEP_0184970770 /NCGR_PEP_ID=MMETSP1098-20130426/3113_1 /TAXON_ID=89044 /ORGANISM="Spumella elongata, Strain CCAP 955/1" /LENGTH=634 /DNA_ID=CAMNT_0027492747 /DNA_START=109 /DNA_END=2013 /DNA_ORIENTATION=-
MSTFVEEEGPIIGIDLGTTYSCVAVYDNETQSVIVLPNSVGDKTTPSWVAFTESGRVVGQPAKQQASMNASNTIYDVKRFIGRSLEDPVTREESRRFPYLILDGGDGRPVIEVEWRGIKQRLSPEEISSMVLLEMKRAAEAALNKTIKKAVITVPAHFNDQQRQATKDAGRIAGLDVVRIINEPTAAALAYGLHTNGIDGAAKQDRPNVVIFDLGGGTFDVSVLSMEGGVFAVKATGGDTHLGGEDFDNTLVDWALKQIEEKHGKNAAKAVKSSHRSQQRLRRAVEAAKRTLSNSNEAEIELDALIDGENFNVTITRAIFEKLNAANFTKCIDTVKAVLRDAGTAVDSVSDVVLVGGSTRIPALQEQLSALFSGRVELCKSINPDEAVAYGAAVQGAILRAGGSGGGAALEGLSSDLVLLDVTPLSLGIELEGKVMSTLIPRNTAIPCVKSREYTTCEDWQTEIDVVVYEGERPQTSANNKLGEFKISGVQRAKRGEPKVEVTFSLDANGILSVTAVDKVTGAQAKADIKADRGRLTDSDIERMIADAERYREEDLALARKIHMRNALEEAIYSVKSSLTERNDIAGISELDDFISWVEAESDSATYEQLSRKGDQLYAKFGVKVDATSRMHNN